jgi:hypothetical protein
VLYICTSTAALWVRIINIHCEKYNNQPPRLNVLTAKGGDIMAGKKQQNHLVKIFGGNLWQAQLIQGLLEANNIACMLRNDTLSAVTSPYSTIGGEVWVLVDERDKDMAGSIIERECISSAPYN